MIELFTWLSHAVEGSWFIALFASFIWGVLSIILSPCHLAAIPLIVGFIDDQQCVSVRRAFVVSTAFSVGILITVAAIGVVTALAGRMAGDIGSLGNYLVAGIFFIVGLHLMDVITLPMPGKSGVGMQKKGVWAAFLLGLFFGVALGPCTFAYMAPMLAVTFQNASSNLAYGILLLGAYAVGHCSVIILAGTFSEIVQRYLNWSSSSKGPVIVKRICGFLVLLGGLWMIYTAH